MKNLIAYTVEKELNWHGKQKFQLWTSCSHWLTFRVLDYSWIRMRSFVTFLYMFVPKRVLPVAWPLGAFVCAIRENIMRQYFVSDRSQAQAGDIFSFYTHCENKEDIALFPSTKICSFCFYLNRFRQITLFLFWLACYQQILLSLLFWLVK